MIKMITWDDFDHGIDMITSSLWKSDDFDHEIKKKNDNFGHMYMSLR